MRKINEIFYSLQGEGFYSGTSAVFVRFSGCNLSCHFCDTDHEQGKMWNDEQIIEECSQYPARHVVLTGGEPSLFIDEAFVGKLKDAGFFVQIETNGTCKVPQNIDWITFSPKQNAILTKCNELKVVYEGQSLSLYDGIEAEYRFLQPCSGANVPEVTEVVKCNPQWQLSVQLHKLINIR
jgi:7-carboxy-7-deazaguanine synthase